MAIQEVFYKESKKTVTGTTGDDLILASTTSVLSATDTVDGGEGDDTVRIAAAAAGKYVLPKALANVEIVEISESMEEISSTDPDASTYMGASAIDVDASQVTGALTIRGNQGVNALTGGAGNDTISGNAGNDVLNGGAGSDVLSGGAGDDIFVFNSTTLEDTVDGGDGTDKLIYSGSGTLIFDETTQAKLTSIESIGLGSVVNGKFSSLDKTGSSINAGSMIANLTLTGNAGANQITGGSGNDTISGGAGKDTLKGGDGDDVIVFNAGTDIVSGVSVDGGAGNDVVKFLGTGIYKLSGVTFTGIESFIIGGTSAAGIDLTGYTGAFQVIGNKAANAITGRNDVAETFIGGGGSDKFDGGKVKAALPVINDSDIFVFKHAAEAKATTIDGGASAVINKVTYADTGTDTVVFNETLYSSSSVINTLVLDGGKSKNIEKVVIWSDAVANNDYSSVINPVAITKGSGTLNLNVNAAKFTYGLKILGNDGVNSIAGGKGADTITGGEGSDTFVYDTGGTGDLSKSKDVATFTPLLDTITDWDFDTSNNDIIDYKTALTLETAIIDPATGGANIAATGEATFTTHAATIGNDLYLQAAGVALSLDAKEAGTPAANVGGDGAKVGEVAYWKNTVDGNSYVFISDGKAGTAAKPLTSGDVVIKLAGFDATTKTAIIDSSGNLLLTGDAGAGGGTTGATVVLTTGTDIVNNTVLTKNNDTIDGTLLDSLNEGITDDYTTDNDTLNAVITGDLNQAITKIENVNITDKFGGHTVDGTTITYAKQVTLDSTVGTSVTIAGVDGVVTSGVNTGIASVKAGNSITDLTVTGITNNPTIIQNKATTITLDAAGAAAGATDKATINLSGTALSIVAGTDDLKTLNLVSSATPSVVTLGAGVLATTSALNISGAADVTLKASAADLDVTNIATISDTLSGSAKFHVDLTTVGTANRDLTGITADDFTISSSAPLDTFGLTFKAGTTNLTLSKNVVNSTGGFTATGAAATDVLNLTETVANTNLVTSGYETVNLTNSTGGALATTTANLGTTAALRINSSQDVTLGNATFKSIDASVSGSNGMTGTAKLTVTASAMVTNTTIKGNANAANIDMSLTSGANTITTFAGNDVLKGGSGVDTFDSGDGNDIISTGEGNDIVLAGAGNDTVNVPANKWDAKDNLQGSTGTDTLILTGNTGGTVNLSAAAGAFTGFEKIGVSDALTGGDLSVTLADASVTGAFTFDAKAANTSAVSFDAHLDKDALFTLNVKSTATTGNDLKTGELNDNISFDGGKDALVTGGKATVTGGKGADTITLTNTASGSNIVLVKGDTGSVTTAVNGMSVTSMDILTGLQDGDTLDLTSMVGSVVYDFALEAGNNVFTAMPATLANNTVYQVKGTYNPTTGTFTAGNGVGDKDSLFIYDTDSSVNTSFEAVVAVGYAKDSTKGLADGKITLGSTGFLLTTANDVPTLTTGTDVIDGSNLDTLNSGDNIVDATEGDADLLNALVSASVAPTITKVETVNITDKNGGHTVTATGITYVDTLTVDTTDGNSMTVDAVKGGNANIASLKAGDNITNLTVTNLEGTGATTPVIIQNNATTITLSDKAADTNAVTINLSGTPLALAEGANDIKILNLVSTAASVVTLGTGVLDNAAATIAVSGTADVTLKADAADLDVAKIATITDTLSGSAKFHVDLTTVGTADRNLTGIAADDFTISSTTPMDAAGLTFAAGTTNLTLAKNVVTGLSGFTATGAATTDVLNLTETVANTNLVTSGYETVNLTNSTGNALSITTTKVTGAALSITSDRDVTLGAATFTSIDATKMTGAAKLTVTGAAIGAAASITGNANDVVADMGLNTGANTITTFDGNDILTGGTGNDVFNSGGGNDTIDTKAGNNTVFTGAGNDIVTLGAGNDNVVTGDGNDNVIFTTNLDWTIADNLQGGLGSDTLKLTSADGGTFAPTAATFAGFEEIALTVAQTSALNITLADGSVSGAMTFSADNSGLAVPLYNTAAIKFDAGLDTDAAFIVKLQSNVTTNIIKTGALNDTITFNGDNGAAAGKATITAGQGGDSITLANTLAGSTLVMAKGDTTVLTVTSLAQVGTLNLSGLTTDVVTGAKAGDFIDLSAISTTALTTQGVVAPTATIPVAFANNQIYQVKGGYVAGVFTEAAGGADSIIVYDADPSTGTSFEAIVLVGFAPTGPATLAGGVLTLV